MGDATGATGRPGIRTGVGPLAAVLRLTGRGERRYDHGAVMSLRLAYAALALGLMTLGILLVWLGVRRPERPAGTLLRVVIGLAAVTALAGVVAVAILEARAVAFP